ncbi:MAG: hypothetical protein Q9201_004158 [Fulgogasparrea decipioides]
MNSSSSDGSGSNTGHEAPSTTISTCAVSSGLFSDGKMENTIVSGGGSGRIDVVASDLQEHQDSSWLDIDYFSKNHLEFEGNANVDQCQKMGDIEDKSESNDAQDGQAEDGSRETDYSIKGLKEWSNSQQPDQPSSPYRRDHWVPYPV